MSNPTQEYNEYIRANLPAGITYDEVRARYVTENGKYFPTYLEAKWYLDYIIKFGAFFPFLLFANGEQGAWYDPSDLTTLYQDAAGTTPVTADGDPVGYMADKSGNGNHATQSTAAARPVYRTDGTLHWLEFDGVDDGLDFPLVAGGESARTVFMAAESNEASDANPLLMLGSDSGTVQAGGVFGITNEIAIRVASGNKVFSSGIPMASGVITAVNDASANVTDVAVFLDGGELIEELSSPRSINLQGSNGYIGKGTYGTIFLYSKCDMYGIIIVDENKLTSRSGVESYLASKSGVTL